jgi:hypothetical protein
VDETPGRVPLVDHAGADARVIRLMHEAIRRFSVDLHGLVVATEAANGPYGTTPVLAALAGAQTWAVALDGPHATAEAVWRETRALSATAGVDRRLHLVGSLDEMPVEACDILTNTGHLRPVSGALAARLPPTAVVPLMYAGWEFRPTDVDLAACEARGALVLATDEAAAGIVDFAGPMCLRMLLEAGVECRDSSILVLDGCPFGPPVARDLRALGASVSRRRVVRARPRRIPGERMERLDAVVVASAWSAGPAVGPSAPVDPAVLAQASPGAAVIQFLGDVDRHAAAAAGVPVWPVEAVPWGHMGLTAGRIGPRVRILLHAASLAWAGVAARVRRAGGSLEAAREAALATGLAELPHVPEGFVPVSGGAAAC